MQARSTGESELLQGQQRRRREARDSERGSAPRRARRRRQSGSWLQRNALSVMAVLVLVSLLSLGFGLLQMLSRPDSASLTLAQSELGTPTTANAAVLSAAAVGGGGDQSLVTAPAQAAQRAIQSSAKVLEPDYTVVAGDTLVKIAQKFNTSVERIQAFNNLADPR